MATASFCASKATEPMFMLFDRPMPARWSCGTPHSGLMRGNSTNMMAISGAPSSAVLPASRAAMRSDGLPTGMLASTSALSKPHTDTSIASATSRLCEYRNCVRIRKKPRKNTTNASRRARSSSVLRAISDTAMATPGSLPSRVWNDHSVSPAASTSTPSSVQRPGSADPLSASRARASSTAALSAAHHGGR